MKNTLKISLVEFDMEWENPKANFNFLDTLIDNHQSDLVLLPEMFSTGFTMNPAEMAEEVEGESYQWMKSKAIEGNCAVVGSVPTVENGKYYNRMYFVTPDKTVIYNKKHLFGYGKETEVYSSGENQVSVKYLGWKFRLIVCYDLRFPVWCRNTNEYDALICPASWPAVRVEPWKALLKARAIENLAYTLGINRSGTDGYNLEYNGNSKVFDPLGEELNLESKKAFLFKTEISKDTVQKTRKKYRFLEDQDGFEIKNSKGNLEF